MPSGSREPGRESGVTLVELVLVLALLGMLLGLSGAALAARRPTSDETRRAALREARAAAVRGGVAQERWLALPGPDATPVHLRFLPDGRVLGPGVEPWTGQPLQAEGAR